MYIEKAKIISFILSLCSTYMTIGIFYYLSIVFGGNDDIAIIIGTIILLPICMYLYNYIFLLLLHCCYKLEYDYEYEYVYDIGDDGFIV